MPFARFPNCFVVNAIAACWLSLSPVQGQGDTVSANLPELSHKRLLNGLQITIAEAPHFDEEMTIGLAVRHGAIFDPSRKGGLAHIVSRMFLKASTDKAEEDFNRELEYLGASFDVECDWDNVRFIVKGRSSQAERCLLLLYQVVGEALFQEPDFLQVKKEVLKELDRQRDPRRFARTQFERSLFRGTSYGRQIEGTRETLERISVGDLRFFYRRYFSPNAASLVVVSSAPTEYTLQKATRIWGVWIRKHEVPFTFLPPRNPASKDIILEDDPSSPAAQFILGSLWPRREDPEFYAGALAARVLEKRLTQALPTSLLTVGTEGRRMTGPFYIQGQAAAEDTAGEIEKVLRIVGEFKASGVGEAELDAARHEWIGQFNALFQSSPQTCHVLLDAETYELGTNYSISFLRLLEQVDGATLQDVAKLWILPGGAVIYVRGPAEILRSEMEKLGTVQPAP